MAALGDEQLHWGKDSLKRGCFPTLVSVGTGYSHLAHLFLTAPTERLILEFFPLETGAACCYKASVE